MANDDFWKNFWFHKSNEDNEKGIHLIGNLLNIKAEGKLNTVLGAKGEVFGGYDFSFTFGKELDFSTGLLFEFKDQDGELEADEEHIETLETKQVKKEAFKRVKESLDQYLIRKTEVILNNERVSSSISQLVAEEYNERIKEKLISIRNNVKTDANIKQQIFTSMIQIENTDISDIENYERQITEKKDSIQKSLTEYNNKYDLYLSYTEKVKTSLINIKNKVKAKIKEAELKKLKKYLNKRKEELEKQKNTIQSVKELKKKLEELKVENQSCRKIIDEYLKMTDRFFSGEKEGESNVLVILSEQDRFSKKGREIELPLKEKLKKTINDFIKEDSLCGLSLNKKNKNIVKVLKEYENLSKAKKTSTTHLDISENNIKDHNRKPYKKGHFVLVYYLTCIAEKMDKIERELIDNILKEVNEEYYLIEPVPEEVKNKTYHEAMKGFESCVTEDKLNEKLLFWSSLNDFLNFYKKYKDAYRSIQFGQLTEVVLRCKKIAVKYNVVYDYWNTVIGLDESVKKELEEVEESLKKLKEINSDEEIQENYEFGIVSAVIDEYSISLKKIETQ